MPMYYSHYSQKLKNSEPVPRPFQYSKFSCAHFGKCFEARRHLSSKCVRTMFRISHHKELCKFFAVDEFIASRRSREATNLLASENLQNFSWWKLVNDVRTPVLDCENMQYIQSVKEFSSTSESWVV